MFIPAYTLLLPCTFTQLDAWFPCFLYCTSKDVCCRKCCLILLRRAIYLLSCGYLQSFEFKLSDIVIIESLTKCSCESVDRCCWCCVLHTLLLFLFRFVIVSKMSISLIVVYFLLSIGLSIISGFTLKCLLSCFIHLSLSLRLLTLGLMWYTKVVFYRLTSSGHPHAF